MKNQDPSHQLPTPLKSLLPHAIPVVMQVLHINLANIPVTLIHIQLVHENVVAVCRVLIGQHVKPKHRYVCIFALPFVSLSVCCLVFSFVCGCRVYHLSFLLVGLCLSPVFKLDLFRC